MTRSTNNPTRTKAGTRPASAGIAKSARPQLAAKQKQGQPAGNVSTKKTPNPNKAPLTKKPTKKSQGFLNKGGKKPHMLHAKAAAPARPATAARPPAEPSGKAAPSANGKFWLYGRHAVEAALNNPLRKAHRLWVNASAAEKLPNLPKSLPVQQVETVQLHKLLGDEAVHQGIALEVSPLEEAAIEDVIAQSTANSLVLILDQVTDPHNIGAILRSAAAFDAAAVVMARDHAPGETATMAKSACGALEITPRVMVTNLSRALDDLKKAGYWVVGLDGSASQALHQHKLSGKIALVLGAEGKGLRRLTLENCDLLAKLPISARMESLNVSNAAAIALYELARDLI